MKIEDLARTIAPECQLREVGIRPGEKLHEVMIPIDDARQTLECEDHFLIQPDFHWWHKHGRIQQDGRSCPDGFYYGSDNNKILLEGDALSRMIAELDLPEAKAWAQERAET